MKNQTAFCSACLGLLIMISAIPAAAGVSPGRAFPLLSPISPPQAPMGAPESDNVVLFQPHDGSFESGYTFATNESVEFVQFWRFPSSEGTLLAFEACFYSYVTVADFEFEFVYYSVSTGGEQAEPGTLREDRDSRIFDIPAGTQTCSIINFVGQGGSADPGVEIRDLLAYLGAKWKAQDYPTVLLLVDENGPDSTNGWGRVTDLFSDWFPLRFTPPSGITEISAFGLSGWGPLFLRRI